MSEKITPPRVPLRGGLIEHGVMPSPEQIEEFEKKQAAREAEYKKYTEDQAALAHARNVELVERIGAAFISARKSNSATDIQLLTSAGRDASEAGRDALAKKLFECADELLTVFKES